jgi:protein-tyrosine phosphatase
MAMDRTHLAAMRWMAPRELQDRPQMLMRSAPELGVTDIPDPYGGPASGYERALDLIEAGCKGLLARLAAEVKAAT